MPEDLIVWLREFKSAKGRRLRVLHVGNIANNAYLNVKFLRSVGIDAHVLSYDYDHVMATPEWEDVELLNGHGNDFLPSFSDKDLKSYRRPEWFVSGPFASCTSKLLKLCGKRLSVMERIVGQVLELRFDWVGRLLGDRARYGVRLLLANPGFLLFKIWTLLKRRLKLESKSSDNNSFVAAIDRWLLMSPFVKATIGADEAGADLIKEHDQIFPEHKGKLRSVDVASYLLRVREYRRIFELYDIVQCYATEPIHALVSGIRPFVAFEHGTLRDFTMGDVPQHRMTALAYRKADHTFITNGDCLEFAKRLGIENYTPIIHPIDVEQHRHNYGDAIAALRREFDADVVLFSPIRHDWKIKGIDVHLRAFPLIKERLRKRVKLVLIRWGNQVADSQALLENAGCGDDVIWRDSMCRITMIKHIRASDVVLDQMALPHFGATAPQAIAAGTPVISSYIPESTKWIIQEPAPILAAFTPEDVVNTVCIALDSEWRAQYQMRARKWCDTYHHPNNVIRDHLTVYRRILADEGQGW